MQIERMSDFPTSPGITHQTDHPFLVFRAQGGKVEGMDYKPPTRGRLNRRNCQILTTNHKTVRESITKKKLAREVGKLVESHIETIRVSLALALIVWFSTSSRLGRNGVSRRETRGRSVDKTLSRFEGVVAT